jgi:2-amino-4-hydroxy-6-hydroxymethyldihydropteridine diphosphokinase
MSLAIVGMGANLGDPARTLAQARDVLAERPELALVAQSALYDTEPVGPPQPRYINAALAFETAIDARRLLSILLETEANFGRVRDVRWGPRALDLDVLAMWSLEGTLVQVREPGLEVPHPRLRERSFALAPLLDVLAAEHPARPEYERALESLGGPPGLLCAKW